MSNSFLSRFVAKYFQPPQEQLEALRRSLDGNEGGTVIYVMRFPSIILSKLFSEYCRQQGLPIPLHTESATLTDQGPAMFAFLRSRCGGEVLLSERRDYRLRIEREISAIVASRGADAVRFVPVTLFAGSAPTPLSPVLRLPIDFRHLPLGEIWTALVLLIYRKRLRINIGPTVSAAKKREGLSMFQRLSLLLYRNEKKFVGTQSRLRSTPAESILGSGEIKRQLIGLAQERAFTYAEANQRARQYLREIAADFSAWVVGLLRIVLHPLFSRVFDRVEILNLHQLREVAGEHPIILLPNHRSHFDYLLLTYALDRQGLSLPHIAAGDNLNIFFVGYFLRHAGGFFIRRKIDDNPLYKLILNQYLTYLLKQGHTIEFYIEGGRSRSGAMLSPRLGLLKYIVRSILTGTRRDVYFMPVGVSYERVAEDDSLARERLGQPKQRESFFNALRLTRIGRKRFGTVSINFGKPISLKSVVKSLVDRHAPVGGPIQKAVARTQPTSSALLPEVSPFTAKLAKLIVREIERNIPLSTTTIFCAALTSFDTMEASPEQIVARSELLLAIIADCLPDEPASDWKTALLNSSITFNHPLRTALATHHHQQELRSCFERVRSLGVFDDTERTDQNADRVGVSGVIPCARVRYYAGAAFAPLLPALVLVEQLLSESKESIILAKRSVIPVISSREQLQERVTQLEQRWRARSILRPDRQPGAEGAEILKALYLLGKRLSTEEQSR